MTSETDRFHAWVEAYALGGLEAEERAQMEAHLAAGCASCDRALRETAAAVAGLPSALAPVATGPTVREQTIDLSYASSLDPSSTREMTEIMPGVLMYEHRRDPARNMRACLVRVRPGVRIPKHRHGGDEVIFVLEGGLRDEAGSYEPGQICHSRAGSIHSEEALPGPDCVCYVLYYGENEPV